MKNAANMIYTAYLHVLLIEVFDLKSSFNFESQFVEICVVVWQICSHGEILPFSTR